MGRGLPVGGAQMGVVFQGGRGAAGWGSEAPGEEPTASHRLSRLESHRLALGGRGALGPEVFLGLHRREGSVEQWLTAWSRVSTFSQPLRAMLPRDLDHSCKGSHGAWHLVST